MIYLDEDAHDLAAAALSEIGPRPAEYFRTAGHVASWTGLCPGNHESAGKREHGKPHKANQNVKPCSSRPPGPRSKTDTRLGARHHRGRLRRMRVVTVGGTRLIGRGLLGELTDRGHEVLLVHRGEHEPAGLLRRVRAGRWRMQIIEAASAQLELVRVPTPGLRTDLTLTGDILHHLLADPGKAERRLGWVHQPAEGCIERSVAWDLAHPPSRPSRRRWTPHPGRLGDVRSGPGGLHATVRTIDQHCHHRDDMQDHRAADALARRERLTYENDPQARAKRRA